MILKIAKLKIIKKTNTTSYPAGTYTFSQNQGLLKINTTIINTYPSLTGLNPYYWYKFNCNLNDSGSYGTLLNCTATGTPTTNTYDISNILATNYINFNIEIGEYRFIKSDFNFLDQKPSNLFFDYSFIKLFSNSEL